MKSGNLNFLKASGLLQACNGTDLSLTTFYEKRNCNICGYLKVIAFLLGYTRSCCCLCERDRGERILGYIQIQWPKRESLIPGQKYLVNTRTLNPEQVYFSPSHIELRLIKSLPLAMDQNSAGFMYFKNAFPKISDTYLLTPCSRVILEKLTGFAASQEIPRIYGTRKFITAFTSATCPYPELDRSSP
jgi:hypothetical protein